MGRYYTRRGSTLYIYVTEGDRMIDLRIFPPELNLFGAESDWRVNERIAIIRGVEEESLEKAEIILGLNGFLEREMEEELLERYFASGDETALGAPAPIIPVGEVILPEAQAPMEVETPLRVETLEAEAVEAVGEGELIDHIIRYIRSRGYSYPDRLIKSYYISMKTKPFVILTGYSGMGKTALTRLFAEAVAEQVEEQYLRIAVQPNWLDDRYLLGFYNPITGRYISTPFLDFLLRAVEHPDRPYFLCLDEMNLSRVEYYFSRFLSAMESIDRVIHLHGFVGGVRREDGKLIPPRLRMPPNLYISGTINIDEASYSLTSKLIDRANVIEFHDIEIWSEEVKEEYGRRLPLSTAMLDSFRGELDTEEREAALGALRELNEITARYGFPISQRVRRETLSYIANSRGIYSEDPRENLRVALDLQVKQRVLTKISGTESIRPILEDLRGYLQGHLPISAEKVERMLVTLNEHGYTSFYA
ncbi:MAG: GTPase subunit of restriction endonuclease-like protein [Candidatus Bathyarchaeota archaeon B23]|nr:MAG: GTPase subunit of restriction endonuclease-like protein [Candidatus Bathyarchaeota archaeon B23]